MIDKALTELGELWPYIVFVAILFFIFSFPSIKHRYDLWLITKDLWHKDKKEE